MTLQKAENQMDELGKLNLAYIKKENLKSLVHHGANSQSMHQMLQIRNKTARSQTRKENAVEKNMYHSNNLIGSALERKTISDNYHTQAYPMFLKCQGPFKVYNHAQSKGQKVVKTMENINQQAQKRFNDELDHIKSLKELEKSDFNNHIVKLEMVHDRS